MPTCHRNPKTKNRAGGDPGAAETTPLEPKHKVHQSVDIHPCKWRIEPDDRDGVEVCLSERGRVVLTQDRPFEDRSQIILHPDEARRLCKILPLAIGDTEGSTAAQEVSRKERSRIE
jgi:hypothetical protein